MSKIKFYEDSAKTNQVYPELDPEEMAQKANIDGYYEEMTVGAADNLTGRGDGVPASFLYRTAGGDDDIADGLANITDIRGRTLTWNQLIQNGNFADGSTYFTGQSSQLSTDNGVLNVTMPSPVTSSGVSTPVVDRDFMRQLIGHKLLVKFDYKCSANRDIRPVFKLYEIQNHSPWNVHSIVTTNHPESSKVTTEWQSFEYVYTVGSFDDENDYARVLAIIYTAVDNGFAVKAQANDVVSIRNFMIVDLTALTQQQNFSITTNEAFTKFFPLPYYEYSTGKFISFTGDALKSVGFNQWDEEWELGSYDTTTGEKTAKSDIVRNKNMISVFPNTNYYFKAPKNAIIFYYDKNKKYIRYQDVAAPGMVRQTPEDCYYANFRMATTYGKVYNNDICYNLSWSGYRNGEYESYWEYTRNLNVTDYFSKGMNYGGVYTPDKQIPYDEITNDKVIKRVWKGTFTGNEVWTLSNTTPAYYYCYVSQIGFPKNVAYAFPNDISYKSGVGKRNYRLAYTVSAIFYDDRYPTVAEWKQHLKELYDAGTPLEIIATLYNSDPTQDQYVVETNLEIPLNLSYKVSDFGTEQILPENTLTPTTSPFNGYIFYGMNAVDTLRRLPENYVSKDSMNNFLDTLGDSTRSNWTATYNEETEQYDYETDLDIDMDRKANIDGYYEEMTVGAADNLTGKGDGVPAQFTRRTSGGDEDIADGIAKIDEIKGYTLIWNQLVKNGNFANDKNWNVIGGNDMYGTLTFNNNICTFTTGSSTNSSGGYFQGNINLISSHKYLVKYSINPSVDTTTRMYFYRSEVGYGGTTAVSISANVWTDIKQIITASGSTQCDIYLYINRNSSLHTGDTVQLKNVVLFDLTAMFGIGNEPSTPEEFEGLFPLNYYEHNTGALLNFTGESLKTTGFNQWDEEWELGQIGYQPEAADWGQNRAASGGIRSKNYISIFNQQYYCTIKSNSSIFAILYDEDKNPILNPSTGYGYFDIKNKILTPPSNARYMRFYTPTAYGTIYQNDICINLSWSGYRNGEYESYWEQIKDFPISTYFPTGMKRVYKSDVTINDVITKDKIINKIKTRTFSGASEENWQETSSQESSSTYLFRSFAITDGSRRYETGLVPTLNSYGLPSGTSIWGGNSEGIILQSNNNCLMFRIKKDKLTDGTVASFQTYLSQNPFTIAYERQDYIETDLEEPLNLSYKVSDFGTEEILPANTSTPTTAPFNSNIVYGINATDTIRRLPESYISEESMEAFLSALNTATNGTWAMTYNSATGKYGFTFTPNQESGGN